MKDKQEILDEYRERLEKARDGEIEEDLEEQMAALSYEVGRAHGSRMDNFKDIGWKDVIELKEEIEDEG